MNDAREGSPTSRRTVLGAGLAGLLAWPLAACDEDARPTVEPRGTRAPMSPDRRLVNAVRTQVTLRQLEVATATKVHPELATGALAGLTRLHRQQLARLGSGGAGDVRITPLPRGWRQDAARTAAAVRTRETRGAQTFASSALQAESGALAGLLAQLAAGVDARLAATAAAPPRLDVEPEVPGAAATAATDALQKTLADEHAALYLYGVLGAHTSASRTPALYTAVDTAYAAHRARRDRLTALLDQAGTEPVASEPGYRIPSPLRTDQQIAAEGLRLERGCAARYLWLVENSVGDDRAFGVGALRNTAVRELSFRGSPEIFPGAI